MGKGGELLKDRLSESRFFLLGEEHDDAQLEMLTANLIPFLKEQGFGHYAAEIDPVAAEELQELTNDEVSQTRISKSLTLESDQFL